jgi:hypothetical protein
VCFNTNFGCLLQCCSRHCMFFLLQMGTHGSVMSPEQSKRVRSIFRHLSLPELPSEMRGADRAREVASSKCDSKLPGPQRASPDAAGCKRKVWSTVMKSAD